MKANTNNKARGVPDNPTETPDRDAMKALEKLRQWYRRKHGMKGSCKKRT